MRARPRKIRSTAVLFFVLVFLSSEVLLQADGIKIRIITQDAILYLKPNKESLQIMKLPMGSIFEILGSSGDWYQIETPPDKNGITVKGFVLQDQAEEITPEDTPVLRSPRGETAESIPAMPEDSVKSSGGKIIGAGISLGYEFPFNSSHKANPKIGGSLSIFPFKYIGLELSGMYSRSITEEDIHALSQGKLSTFEIGLCLIGRLPIKDIFTPYVSVGGCYSLNGFRLDDDLINTWDDLGFDLTESVENAYGAVLSAGLDFKVVSGLRVGIDFKCRLMTTEGAWTFTDQSSSAEEGGTIKQLNMNSASVFLGIKYYF